MSEIWPFRVAVAWMVTHGDAKFVEMVHSGASHDPHLEGDALDDRDVLAGCLFSVMWEAKCFSRQMIPSEVKGEPPYSQDVLVEKYEGRFRKSAAEFEAARSKCKTDWLFDKEYLRGRIDQSVAEICRGIRNGEIRGAAGIPVDAGVEGRVKKIQRHDITEVMTWANGLLHQGRLKVHPCTNIYQKPTKGTEAGWKSVQVPYSELVKCYRGRKSSKVGRSPKYDWAQIQQKAYKYFDAEGDWEPQANVERYIMELSGCSEPMARVYAKNVCEQLTESREQTGGVADFRPKLKA